ncbi:hypothetical protein [Streptomyces sp. NPDC005374]|uniref:hypothetical protein n=1 Tax=Streptomyces sp. NPDC005374 TaxID=3364713 RepID=UPI0036C70D8A
MHLGVATGLQHHAELERWTLSDELGLDPVRIHERHFTRHSLAITGFRHDTARTHFSELATVGGLR